MLRSALRHLLHTYSHRYPSTHPGAAMLGELYGQCTDGVESDALNSSQHPLDQSAERYLLFFDGGSRGNPGPGGSGAVIVATDVDASHARIIWSASISHKNPSTTNNQAEYNGVICGLKAAQQASWKPIEVIGDSMLILRQLRLHRPPLSTKLLPLYATATRLADSLGLVHWHHHLRVFNKMADLAANVAMDSQSSIQVHHPTLRVEHRGLLDHLEGDFSHWHESTPIA